MTAKIEINQLGNYRVLREDFPVAIVVLMADGSGWRVRSFTAGRKGQRQSYLSPRQAFKVYFKGHSWAMPLADQLPNLDYRTGKELA